MARDWTLMERARKTGETVFSVYGWSRPTLSLGRNQPAAGRYDLDMIASLGMDVVRRPTGGRALLHNREVTYSVTSPIEDTQSLGASYARFNRILLNGLAQLGVAAAESKSPETAPRPGDAPCFAIPADGELIVNGMKLVGSAQVRENGALLQHGSILIDDDQHLIAQVLRTPAVAVPGAATLRQLMRREPAPGEVAEALFKAVRELEDATADHITEAGIDADTDAEMARYESEWWTWRR